MSLAIAGCTWSFHFSAYDDGFDFPGENVHKILQGKTTGDELIQLFGGPLEKYEVSESEEVWKYYYSSGTEFVQKGLLSDGAYTTRQDKTLDIQLKNGTVTSFTYIDNHEP